VVQKLMEVIITLILVIAGMVYLNNDSARS